MHRAEQTQVGAGGLELGRNGQIPLQVQPLGLALESLDQTGDAAGLIGIGPAPTFGHPAAGDQAAPAQGIHQGLGVQVGKEVQA